MCRFSIINTKENPFYIINSGSSARYVDTLGLAVKKLHTSQASINGKVAVG